MPFQLPESAVQLLQVGESLLFGNRPDNLVRATVIGPSLWPGNMLVRLLEDYDTRRPHGNSFRRAGQEVTAKVGDLWSTRPTSVYNVTPSG